jgi:hypothetical protein
MSNRQFYGITAIIFVLAFPAVAGLTFMIVAGLL